MAVLLVPSFPAPAFSMLMTYLNCIHSFMECHKGFHSIFAYSSPMGGERVSTTRQRLAGKICAICSNTIDLGMWPGGERRCDKCAGIRKVYMTYFHRDGWSVQFLEPDLKTPVGRIRQLGSLDKVKELIARTPTRLDLAADQAIEHAITVGRGGMYLDLTAEQYQKLRG
jgi:hypothetical protein